MQVLVGSNDCIEALGGKLVVVVGRGVYDLRLQGIAIVDNDKV